MQPSGILVTTELPPAQAPLPMRIELVQRVLATVGSFLHRSEEIKRQQDELRLTRELLELRSLKAPDQCHRVASRLRTRVAAVEQKIADLQAFREELLRSLKRCENAIERRECCPVVVELGSARPVKQ